MSEKNSSVDKLEAKAVSEDEQDVLNLDTWLEDVESKLKKFSEVLPEETKDDNSQGISEVDMAANDIAKEKFLIHSEFSKHALEFSRKVGNTWIDREVSESDTRDTIARALVGLLGVFMIFTGKMIWLQGVQNNDFELSDSVFVAFLGSFATSFLGLIVIIFKYFYSERSIKSLDVIRKFIVDMSGHNRQYDDKNNGKASE